MNAIEPRYGPYAAANELAHRTFTKATRDTRSSRDDPNDSGEER